MAELTEPTELTELTVESGPQQGQRLEIRREEPFTVGSDDSCSLALKAQGIEPQHLVIKALKDGGFGVKKLTGSFLLNGKDCEAARLRQGDSLELEGLRLRFGRSRENSEVEEVGEVETDSLGGFRLMDILGKGGMGTVYRAEQVSLHREVALKVLTKVLTKDPVFVARFVAEARAAARLSHKNVVHVFDVGHEGDTYFYSMELMHGGTLEDRLRQGGKIPVEEALQHICDAAEGLAYAESLRIVHRDIKPDNLMLDQHQRVKITDLGLAMTDEDDNSKVVGTPHFMSPEQVQRRPLDHRSDLYSLGCTFFRLVTGRNLFQGKRTTDILKAHLKEDPPEASELDPEVPAKVSDIIGQLVEKDPEERYQSAAELLADLQQVQSPPARKGLLVAGITAVVLAAGFAIYWGLTRENGKTVITKIEEDLETRKRLAEAEARTALQAVLLSQLPPEKKALKLEAMATEHQGTVAAGEAVAEAGRIRAAEAKAAEARAAHRRAVRIAQQELRQILQPAITEGRFRDAAVALQQKTLKATLQVKVLGDPAIQKILAESREQLKAAAGKKLASLKEAVATAEKRREPEKMLLALEPIEAVLDAERGWPKATDFDRRELRDYVSGIKKQAKHLQGILLREAESGAWASFRQAFLSPAGVLAKVHAFDLDGAVQLATLRSTELKDYSTGKQASQILELVRAAKSFLDQYQAAARAGRLYLPMELDRTSTPAKVRDLVLRDEKRGLLVEVPNGQSSPLQSRFIAFDSLAFEQLQRILTMPSAKEPSAKEPGKAPPDPMPGERLALLGLHLLWTHLQEAQGYLARIDPKVPASGTGDQRFRGNTVGLRVLLRGLTRLEKPPAWSPYLAAELRAVHLLVMGLRAFSQQKYSATERSISSLLERHKQSLVVQSLQ